MLYNSNIKPLYNYDSLVNTPSQTIPNLFVQNILKTNPKQFTEHYPQAHTLLPHYNYAENNHTLFHHNGVFFLGLTMLIWLTYIRVQFPQVIKRLITSIYNFQYARQLVDKKSGIMQKSSWFLLILFLFSFSLFLTAFIFYISPVNINTLLYLYILILITLFYTIKVALFLFLGYLTDTIAETKLILSHFSVFYRNISLIFTPLSIILFFIKIYVLKYLFIFIWIVFILLTLMRIYRGLFLYRQMRFSYLYIFLYLCTVEIIPLLYSLKILIMLV